MPQTSTHIFATVAFLVALGFGGCADQSKTRDERLADIEVEAEPWVRLVEGSRGGVVRDVAVAGPSGLYAIGEVGHHFTETVEECGYTFLAKYSLSGEHLWTRKHAFDYCERPTFESVAVDRRGNAYVAGSTLQDIGDQTVNDSTDALLAKYTPSGKRVWVRLLGTPRPDDGQDVAVTDRGDVYVAGDTSGNLHGETTTGPTDAFVAKYDTAGDRAWTRLVGSSSIDYALAVAAAPSSDVYVAGRTWGALGGNADGKAERDTFIARLDSSGNRIWADLPGDAINGLVHDLAVDGGTIYAVGLASGEHRGRDRKTEPNSGGHGFLASFSRAGTRNWLRLAGPSANTRLRGLSIDPSGKIHVVGRTSDALSTGNFRGSDDAFTARYEPSGDRTRLRRLDSPARQRAYGISAIGPDQVFIGGSTTGELMGQVPDKIGPSRFGHSGFVAFIE